MINIAKILSFLTVLIIVSLLMYFCISLVSFMGHKGREDYHWLCLYEVQERLLISLENRQMFPENEEELNELIYAKYFGEPHYKWKVKYRLIDEKDNKVIFFIVVDSTKELDFLTYEGLVTPGLGQAKKNEKGEWHGTIEWFFKTQAFAKEF